MLLAIKVFVLLSLIIMFAPQVSAKADGHRLLKRCTTAVKIYERKRTDFNDADFNDAYYCSGLIRGLLDMNFVYQGKLAERAMFCLPKNNLKTIDGMRAVVRYLRAHPDRLDQGESFLAILALIRSFPCKGSR